jgi:anti-sigma B factor antagonist
MGVFLMKIKTQKIGKTIVIKVLEGRLDACVKEEIESQANQAIQKEFNGFVFNLSQIEFMDSAGLGILVSVLRRLQMESKVTVCSLKEVVKNLFELTRMNSVFPVFADEESAIKAIDCFYKGTGNSFQKTSREALSFLENCLDGNTSGFAYGDRNNSSKLKFPY